MNALVQPYLFFNGRAEEALAFYQKALGATVEMMMRYSDAPLQPGEAETTKDRRVHGFVKRAGKRKGALVELVRTLGAVTIERNKGGSERDPDVKFECIAVG